MVKAGCRKHWFAGAFGLSLLGLVAVFGGRAGLQQAVHPGPSADSDIVLADGEPTSKPVGVEDTQSSEAALFPETEGPAAALALRDFARALDLTDGLPEAAEGTEAWVFRGLLRGRALRHLGRHEEAVAELGARWNNKTAQRMFPADVLGLELARAQLGFAGTLPAEQADAQRKEAIRVLDRVAKLDDLRNLAEIRVLQAEAMLAVQGTDARSTAAAARKAVTAIGQILRDYPNHPRAGEFWLAQAQAMVRAGQTKEGAAELRAVHIHRAGEPESEAAWQALEALAEASPRLGLRPLSVSETVDRASSARTLRWVDLSRELLDRVIEDPATPSYMLADARSQRSWTAYKQRDFGQCADDVRPVYTKSPNYELRDHFLRCLERGELYEEALGLWAEQAKSKRTSLRRQAQWEAAQLAFRAGRYAEALEWVERYEKSSRGHAQARAWLRAWIPMRLGQVDEAIAGFERAERYAGDRTRARYFRGKLLLEAKKDPKEQAQGESLLAALANADPYGYYGLAARQRLLAAGRTVAPVPPLQPMADEGVHPTRVETQAHFDELDLQFGDAWPAVRRGRQLYAAGYLEEARREVRIATETVLTGGGKTGGPRNESFIVGLGWKANWSHPRFPLSKAARAQLRQPAAREALRVGLRAVALGVDEPYRYIRLSTPEDGHWKARWQPRPYRFALDREARLQNIDPVHLWSLMYTESRFRRFVVSAVGARGALQIMPWTGRQLAERLGEFEGTFDTDSLFDIDTNAHLASYYIAELLRKFKGQAPMAYASYNGGPSNVARWLRAKSKAVAPLEMDVFIEEMVFDESYRYAKRVMEVAAVYGLLYGEGLPTWDNTVDPVALDNIDF